MLVQTLGILTANVVNNNFKDILNSSKNKSKDIVNIFKVACENSRSESCFSLRNKSILKIKWLLENGQLTLAQICEIVREAKKHLPKEHEFNQFIVLNFNDSFEKIKINKLIFSTIPQFKTIDSNYPETDKASIKILTKFLKSKDLGSFADELPTYSFKDWLYTYEKNQADWKIQALNELLENELISEDPCSILNIAFNIDDQRVVHQCLETISNNFKIQDPKDEKTHKDFLLKLFNVACKHQNTQEKAKTWMNELIEQFEVMQNNNKLTKAYANQIMKIAKKYLPEDHPFCAKVTLISNDKEVDIDRLVLLTIPHFNRMFQSGMKESKNSTIEFNEKNITSLKILEMMIKEEDDSLIKAQLESLENEDLWDIHQRSTFEWEDTHVANLVFDVLLIKFSKESGLETPKRIGNGFTLKTTSQNKENLTPILKLFEEYKINLNIELLDEINNLEEVQSTVNFFNQSNVNISFYHYYVKLNIVKNPETILIEANYELNNPIKKTDEKNDIFKSVLNYLMTSFNGKKPSLKLEYSQKMDFFWDYNLKFLTDLYKCLPTLTCLKYPTKLFCNFNNLKPLSKVTNNSFPDCKIEEML